MLFAVNTVFVSEQASIVIDLANKKGQIEYIDLMTPRKGTDVAEAGLKEISEATDFDQYFTQLELTFLKIYEERNKLNATLRFSYETRMSCLNFYTLAGTLEVILNMEY